MAPPTVYWVLPYQLLSINLGGTVFISALPGHKFYSFPYHSLTKKMPLQACPQPDLFVCLFCFSRRLSLCSSNCYGTCSVDQASLCLWSAGIKSINHHCLAHSWISWRHVLSWSCHIGITQPGHFSFRLPLQLPPKEKALYAVLKSNIELFFLSLPFPLSLFIYIYFSK